MQLAYKYLYTSASESSIMTTVKFNCVNLKSEASLGTAGGKSRLVITVTSLHADSQALDFQRLCTNVILGQTGRSA